MQSLTKTGIFLAFTFFFLAPTGFLQAQEHVTSDADLRSAVAERTDREAADRAVLERLLDREEVREIAGDADLDLERAKDAVAQLDGEELGRLASMARDAEDALAGGQTTITITSTAIIIALLVIILLIVT